MSNMVRNARLVTMSDDELDRTAVVVKVLEKRLTQSQAAVLLGITARRIRRLVVRYQADGAAGLVSRKRGGVGNHAKDAALRAEVIALIRDRYSDFGPTLIAEKLAERHDRTVSRETIRRWMIAEGLWSDRRASRQRACQPRYRRDCFGELIQIDGSEHAWLEYRGPKACLLVFIDDAISKLVELRFCDAESTFDYMHSATRYLARHGKPVAFYSDKHSVFSQGPAVLKVLSDRGLKAGELTGAKALRLWSGEGTVHVLGLHDRAMLLEYLPGPCLGDVVAAGRSVEAARIIAGLAIALQRPATAEIRSVGFMGLKDNFDAALSNADIRSFPLPYREIFARAQRLWRSLIDSTQAHCLLHGDLNLDNVLQSPRGWVAIDPKGLIGDPCYEFAITFRTPFNTPEVTASRERILSLAEIYASLTGLDKSRILQFGFAHVALSLSWHLARGNRPEADLVLLKTFDSLDLTR